MDKVLSTVKYTYELIIISCVAHMDFSVNNFAT